MEYEKPEGTLYDEEFADSFAVLESQYKNGWKEQRLFCRQPFCAVITCAGEFEIRNFLVRPAGARSKG